MTDGLQNKLTSFYGATNGQSSLLQRWIIQQRVNFAVLGLFLILSIIAAWPVVTNLNSVIIGDDTDVYINPWADWWTGKAFSDPDISLWKTNHLFYPNGANLVYHSFSHLNSWVSLGLRPFVGALPAYNLTMLINLVLNGFSMFQLSRYLTKSDTAGLLAGIVFAFNSQITYHSSHPVLFSGWSLCWTTLYLIRAVRENSYRYAFIAAFFVFLGATTSVLMVVLTGIWLLLLVIYMFLAAEFPRPQWKILLTFGLSSTILVLLVVSPLLLDAITNRNSSFVIAPEESLSTEIISIFIPSWFVEYKRSIYLGIVPVCLFFLAVRHARREIKLWFLLAGLSFLIAIGPVPTFFGRTIDIVLPWSLVVTPFLRDTYRMMILFAFGWAMITAFGWVALKSTVALSHRSVLFLTFLVGLLIYVEYTITPYPTTAVNVSSFYTDYLDDVPNDVVLAILPTGRQEDKRYLHYQTVHEHPITGGVISRAEAETFNFIESNPVLRAGAVDLESVPIPDNIEAGFQELAALHVGYFILDKTLMENEAEWREAIPFEPVYEDELLVVYETGLD